MSHGVSTSFPVDRDCSDDFSPADHQIPEHEWPWRDANADIVMQFDMHKCMPVDSSQNALRIVKEATETDHG